MIEINLKKDFWQEYPLLRDVPIFAEFIDKYGEKNSSMMMWALCMGRLPDGIIYKSYLKLEERNHNINLFLVNKKVTTIDFSDSSIKNLISAFERVFIPPHRYFLTKMEQIVYDYFAELEGMAMNKNKLTLLKGYKDISIQLADSKKIYEDGEKNDNITSARDGGKITVAQNPMLLFDEEDFE